VRIKHAAVAAVVGLAIAIAACTSDDASTIPVRPAPPSRSGALVDALADDARAFAFQDGDWGEDLGDAPFYGVAWLSRRAESKDLDADGLARRDAALVRANILLAGGLADGDIQEKVTTALGLIEHIAASHDRSRLPALDDFVDRLGTLSRTLGDYLDVGADKSWAIRTYGPTSITALVALVHAQYALLIGGGRAQERLDRAVELDAKIHERAFGDLFDDVTGIGTRGYAFAPGQVALIDYPNIAMLILKARLFRLTKREEFRLEARALYAALQPLKLSDAPARYASPYAKASLGVDARDLTTLSSQNYLTLGLMLLFEITGEQRFIDEADRLIDGIAAMRGPWCTSQVDDPTLCAPPGAPPACTAGQACVSKTCTVDRCTTGLLHHVIQGRLALPKDGTLFCAGCNLQTLYVLGYRRTLAGERY
jgi:hypothetical protein